MFRPNFETKVWPNKFASRQFNSVSHGHVLALLSETYELAGYLVPTVPASRGLLLRLAAKETRRDKLRASRGDNDPGIWTASEVDRYYGSQRAPTSWS